MEFGYAKLHAIIVIVGMGSKISVCCLRVLLSRSAHVQQNPHSPKRPVRAIALLRVLL